MCELAEISGATRSEEEMRALKLWLKASNHTGADLLGLAAQKYREAHLWTNGGGGGRQI